MELPYSPKRKEPWFKVSFILFGNWPGNPIAGSHGIAFVIVLSSYFLLSNDAYSASQQYRAVDLSVPFELDLDFGESEYLLVTVSQDTADFVLDLRDRLDSGSKRKVNISSIKGLEEYLLVHKNDCEECYIVLDGAEQVDRASPYLLTLEPIQHQGAAIDASSRLEILRRITQAAETRGSVGFAAEPDRKQLMSRFEKELRSAAAIQLEGDDYDLHLHVLTLLAETLFYLDKEEEQVEILKTIRRITTGENSKYRAQAFYELAPLEKNIFTQREYYDEGMAIAKVISDQHLYAMGANFKATNFVRDGKFDEGIALLKEAFDIYSASGRWRNLFEPLHNLSWSSQLSRRMPESLTYATQQKLLAQRHGFDEHIIWSLYNIGRSYRGLGEWFVAEKFYDDALTRLASMTIKERTSLAVAKAYLYQEKTEGLIELGALQLASDYAKKMREEFSRQAYKSRTVHATFLEGDIATASSNFSLAETKYLQVLDYDIANKRQRSEGATLLRLAELNIRQGKYVAASAFQSKALGKIAATDDYNLLSDAFSQAVELLHRLGGNAEAKNLVLKTEKFIERFGDDEARTRHYYRRASVARALGDKEAALGMLAKSILKIEEILPKVRRRDLRQSYFALQKAIFEMSIDIMLEGGDGSPLEALALVEKYKSRSLEEEIASFHQDGDLSPEQLRARTELHAIIQSQATSWYSDSDLDIESFLSDARSASFRLEKLETEIQEQRSVDVQVGKIPHDHNQFKPLANELIAYYFVGANKSWVWTLVNDSLEVHELPAEREIEKQVNLVKFQLSMPPTQRPGKSALEERKELEDLSATLLTPLSNFLKSSEVNKITIIADGPLNGVPFAPLLLEPEEGPLILQFPIYYLHSLGSRIALIDRSRKYDRANSHKALVVADPVGKINHTFELAELPHTKNEAQEIKAIFGADAEMLVSENAQKSKFLSKMSKKYSILHFATHGLLNEQVPALSGLVFSESADGGDLWLTSEIRAASIDADLVVLSACETSTGKRIAGEGLFSLSRSFLEGGANQVVGTLWKVEDSATSKLIARFYAALTNDAKTVSLALQHAQSSIYRDQENDWTDPYYWAGFQLMGGEDQPIYGYNQKSW